MSKFIRTKLNRRNKKILDRPVRITDMDFANFYEEISADWLARARALRERRLATLRYQ